MMETYFLWRLSMVLIMVLITVLTASVFVAIYNIANTVLHSRIGKESEHLWLR